jgi:hypothetical protein
LKCNDIFEIRDKDLRIKNERENVLDEEVVIKSDKVENDFELSEMKSDKFELLLTILLFYYLQYCFL